MRFLFLNFLVKIINLFFKEAICFQFILDAGIGYIVGI